MSSYSWKLTYFGPYEITSQVFYSTLHSYCLVNIKPLLPGHVLVVSNRIVPRFTDLNANEVTDLYMTVQKVQRMLAKVYFKDPESEKGGFGGKLEDGAFNVAMQDGVSAGQTVPHVHVHIIPRPKDSPQNDQIYDRMESEEGNVGGALWDRSRPVNQGKFAKPEESERKNRTEEEMVKEANFFREQMELVD
ncbi:HIT domain-containing protein [Hyaloscypha bicolor E]|uniref:Bis(5'-adenosyl)-triphosphatase n=1 Tax=Hyaloscypha bicolor E TaxID=1095630 RepID=A0A2J6SIE0_9HELO|nr:HIT domain-containing protein [Hyaloscypha bicolor E]PMD50527.1 HIT domain-containing protein [Hyaloscypha bicolor E]